MAQTMTRVDQNAYLYCFAYAETGKRASLGAYHGEELKFLSDSFPSDWEHVGKLLPQLVYFFLRLTIYEERYGRREGKLRATV
jgi:hypothetical protein